MDRGDDADKASINTFLSTNESVIPPRGPVLGTTMTGSQNDLTTSAVPSPSATLSERHADKHVHASKIVSDFQGLLEKSQNMFNGLRDLPHTGGQRLWQPYFQRTFETFTKLWKLQQQHRQLLEQKEVYGLKRWEVGEVASKIGQLYYHYYLRTSDTNYLNESYVFYVAIRERSYFREVLELKNTALMIKKLRYYARYVVVALVLDKIELVKKLLEELTFDVEEYSRVFKVTPADTAEWQTVLTEVSTFLMGKSAPLSPAGIAHSMVNRLQIKSKPLTREESNHKFRLQEVVLIGFYEQAKFSELTMDMFRMLQALERDPFLKNTETSTFTEDNTHLTADSASTKTSEQKNGSITAASKRGNPHKYLLYRPSIAQVQVHLAASFKDTADHTAMLVYLSGPGLYSEDSKISGGVSTAGRKADVISCIHTADLIPYTRKAMFLIVESDNSSAFVNFGSPFGAPVVCLMSPRQTPSGLLEHDYRYGSLFTMFLHSPVQAFCLVSKITECTDEQWSFLVAKMKVIEDHLLTFLSADTTLHKHIVKFMEDDFCRRLIVRYVLCLSMLNRHTLFTGSQYLPKISPPQDISTEVGDTVLQTHLTDLIKSIPTAQNLWKQQ